jgi:hypothetical protein
MATSASQTHLVPIQEMSPGQVVSIRNSVINQLLAIVATELSLPQSQLVVRDIQPYTDLSWDYGSASAGTAENWEHDMTGTTVGYTTMTENTMGDQRYVAIFGVRDISWGQGATAKDATDVAVFNRPKSGVSLIKFTVGGAIKAIWDMSALAAYTDAQVGFAPSAVLIPQNASYAIAFYQKNIASVATAKSVACFIQLIGVTIEPRGKVISP